MSSKCSMYIQGQWCQLDTENGTVRDPSNAIHRPRFFYIRRGELRGLQSELVLRELRAFHTAQPSRFVEGTPLPRSQRPFRRERARRRRQLCDCSRRGNSRERSKSRPSRAPPRCAPHTQVFHKHNSPRQDCRPIPTVDASTQMTQRHADWFSTSGEDSVKRAARGTGRTAPSSKQTDDMKQHVSPSKRTGEKTLYSTEQTRAQNPTKQTRVQSDPEDEVPIKLRLLEKRSPAKRKRIESDSSTVSQTSADRSESAREQEMTFIKLIFGAKPQMKGGDKNCGLLQRKLRVTESDVATLREYIANAISDADGDNFLYRFDNDEKFKVKLFYRINPLVHVERCPRIDEMLARDESHDEISLKDFAGRLGLRHVEDATHERCRTKRKEVTQAAKHRAGGGKLGVKRSHRENGRKPRNYGESAKKKYFELSSSDTDSTEDLSKENKTEPIGMKEVRVIKPILKKRAVNSRGEVISAEGESDRKKESRRVREKGESVAKVANDSGSDNDFVTKKVTKKKQNQKIGSNQTGPAHGPSHTGGFREYSPLEDHAILSWLVAGGTPRERSVNGNKIWRQLQEQYTSLTGCWRSWHSLRNRYLRYILPELGCRDVPLALAARLRAHAALGEMKNRKRSVAAEPTVVSAWSLRPRAPPPLRSPSPRGVATPSGGAPSPVRRRTRSPRPDHVESESPRRRPAAASPRRRPAAASPRRRPSAVTSQRRPAAASSQRRPAAAASPPPARRKLYNPKAM